MSDQVCLVSPFYFDWIWEIPRWANGLIGNRVPLPEYSEAVVSSLVQIQVLREESAWAVLAIVAIEWKGDIS